MSLVAWSIVVGALGLLVTWSGTIYFNKGTSRREPYLYWFLGLIALLPAWLIGFVGLLGPSPSGRPEVLLSASFILTSTAAILGVIVTDAAVRRLRESERTLRPVTYWLLGVATLFPAWCIALLGLAWARP